MCLHVQYNYPSVKVVCDTQNPNTSPLSSANPPLQRPALSPRDLVCCSVKYLRAALLCRVPWAVTMDGATLSCSSEAYLSPLGAKSPCRAAPRADTTLNGYSLRGGAALVLGISVPCVSGG